MKKLYIFLFLLLSIFLIGCNETVKEIVVINIENVEMSSEKEEIIYTINIVNEKLITEKNNIVQFNYYYSFTNNNKNELIKQQKNEITNKQLTHKVSFDSNNYDQDLSIIFELKLAKDGFIYSKVNTINIGIFAKEQYIKNPNNEIAKNICDPFKVNEITLQLDYNETKLSGETDLYYYSCVNEKLQKITLVITLKGKYTYGINFQLYVNNEKIDSKKYTIEGGVLTYIFSDPNWSIII